MHGKITKWINRIMKYNIEIYHKPDKLNLIGIINGLFRFPENYQDKSIKINKKQLVFILSLEPL